MKYIDFVDGCILSFSLRYGLRLIRPSLRNDSGFSTIVLATSSKIRCAIPIKGKHQYKPPEADAADNTSTSHEETKSPPELLTTKEETLPAVPSKHDISSTELPHSGADIVI